MNYGRELLKGNTDSLLLCLISRQPTYGYQIVKELEKRSNGYFQFKEGTLYPALHRLERRLGATLGGPLRDASVEDHRMAEVTVLFHAERTQRGDQLREL